MISITYGCAFGAHDDMAEIDRASAMLGMSVSGLHGALLCAIWALQEVHGEKDGAWLSALEQQCIDGVKGSHYEREPGVELEFDAMTQAIGLIEQAFAIARANPNHTLLA